MHIGYLLDVPGESPPRVAVSINGPGLKAHTAIVAQSGSGKSFMLGRFLEEIVRKTRARVAILDPNSDFVRFSQVNEAVWHDPRLERWLDESDTQERFTEDWERQRFVVLTQRQTAALGTLGDNVTVIPCSISWAGLSLRDKARYLGLDMVSHPQEIYALYQASATHEEEHEHGHETGGGPTLARFVGYAGALWAHAAQLGQEDYRSEWPSRSVYRRDIIREVSAEAALAVHGRAFELSDSTSIWDTTSPADGIRMRLSQFSLGEAPNRIAVIDLASLRDHKEQLVVAGEAIDAMWEGARKAWERALLYPPELDARCPTFIVIDEAHNVIPEHPEEDQAKHVVEGLVRIAAEGRKYGIFLVLVTQRPSRVNSSVLSQCDNLCVLRMSNHQEVELVEGVFGILPRGWVQRATQFGVGDALVCGAFIDRPCYAHIAPRRTIEGGRNIRDEHWTSPL